MGQSIILYSTGCPQCKVLEEKLHNANIAYVKVNDVDLIASQGIRSVPVLQIEDEKLDFPAAIKWVNNRRDK